MSESVQGSKELGTCELEKHPHIDHECDNWKPLAALPAPVPEFSPEKYWGGVIRGAVGAPVPIETDADDCLCDLGGNQLCPLHKTECVECGQKLPPNRFGSLVAKAEHADVAAPPAPSVSADFETWWTNYLSGREINPFPDRAALWNAKQAAWSAWHAVILIEMQVAKESAAMITSRLYYSQKDGCKHDHFPCGKICYNCVEEELETILANQAAAIPVPIAAPSEELRQFPNPCKESCQYLILDATSEQYRKNWLALKNATGFECHLDALEFIKQAVAAPSVNEEMRELLGLMYDRWENGVTCYEDPEDCAGHLGNAFKLDGDEEDRIIAVLAKADQAPQETK
jgi:hypothetical protein